MWKSAIWWATRISSLFGHTAEEIEANQPQWLPTPDALAGETTRSREAIDLDSARGTSAKVTADLFHPLLAKPLQQ